MRSFFRLEPSISPFDKLRDLNKVYQLAKR